MIQRLFFIILTGKSKLFRTASRDKVIVYIAFIIFIITSAASCNKDNLLPDQNNVAMLPKLSDYDIFQGTLADLTPHNGYTLYEVSSQLFTDYAEKQRLIKVPHRVSLPPAGNSLLSFPDSTILVKTFYYHLDKRETNKGKNIIETRVMIKNDGKWNVGTYQWNDQQTDAYLVTPGVNKTVSYIDGQGAGKTIAYHIPSNNECATCHNSGNTVIPIGPKVRNLNFNVLRSGKTVNQITHLENMGILNHSDPGSFSSLPDYRNTSLSLEQRARAYLDINCAHCHSSNGFASSVRYRMDYEVSLEASKIKQGKNNIALFMEKGLMPKIGITVIDEEGAALIKQYLNTL